MQNRITEDRILEALRRMEPLPPIKHELGGGEYYTCHWLECCETVNKFMEWCPKCGQKILWEYGYDK